MSLDQFKASRIGTAIAPLLTSNDAIRRMEELSRRDRPAVEAVGGAIANRVGDLDDRQRKLVGRWVGDILAKRGWRPHKKGRVAPGQMFAKGTVYRPAATAVQKRSGVERLAEAQAMVRALAFPIMGSQQLIAERRRAFESDD